MSFRMSMERMTTFLNTFRSSAQSLPSVRAITEAARGLPYLFRKSEYSEYLEHTLYYIRESSPNPGCWSALPS